MKTGDDVHPGVRLALCAAGELFGGVERHLLGLCTWLLREGGDPLLVLFHDRELARQVRRLGVKPVVVESRSALDLAVPGRLGRYFAAHEVTVVHAHGYKAVVNCAVARRHHPFALMRTVHGLVEPGKGLNPARFRSGLYARLERLAGRRAGAAVTYVTEDLRRRHERFDRGLLTRTVHNGIDPLRREDYARPDDLEEGPLHLAAVGRISQVKGLKYAIGAMDRLDPDLDIVLNIIGTGPLESYLKSMVSKLGLGQRVRFLGFKQNIYDYLSHIDALLMPSLHEGLPYTVLEAMSLGVPIVASRVGGMGEVLEDRDTALLVRPRSIEDIVVQIGFLVDNRSRGRDIGERARMLQRATFDLDSTCEAMIEVAEAVSGNE